jgi:hypothetical protein
MRFAALASLVASLFSIDPSVHPLPSGVHESTCDNCREWWSSDQGYIVHTFGFFARSSAAGGSLGAEHVDIDRNLQSGPSDNGETQDWDRLTHFVVGDAGVRMDCASWNSCHGDVQPGFCRQWHDECYIVWMELNELADQVLSSKSLLQISALKQQYPNRARYSPDGRRLELIDCGGVAARSIPLS